MEFTVFDRNTQGGDGALCVACHDLQLRAGFDAGPKHSRVSSVGEPAYSTNRDLDGTGRRHSRERILDLLKTRLGPFSDELGGHMQVLHGAPGELRAGAEAIDKETETNRDFAGNI